MFSILIILLPLVTAIGITLKWPGRPVLRLVAVAIAIGWLSIICWGTWTIRHKPAYAHMTGDTQQSIDDFVAGATAMSRVVEPVYTTLYLGALILAAAFVYSGFQRQKLLAHQSANMKPDQEVKRSDS